RHGVAPPRLGIHGQGSPHYGRPHLTRAELKEDAHPIQADCGCYTCRTGFSRGYIRHLFAANELLAYTLASLHNLFFIQDLMRRIRAAVRADALSELRDTFLSRYGVAYPTLGVSPQSA